MIAPLLLAPVPAFLYFSAMRKLTAVLTALVIPACSSTPSPVGAQEPAPDTPRTVQVSATAEVQRAPDRAVIHLAVETVADDAGAATRENAERMDAVLRAVAGLGIERSAIQTQRLDLQPRYDRRRDAVEPEIVGYQATNLVRVRVDEVGRVGEVVDAAVAAGANRVAGIGFELADPEAAYHEALQRAIAKAAREAEVIAGELGETLGPALSVSTGGGPSPVFQMGDVQMRAVAEQAMAPPVETGELDVRASVRITYRLGS